MARQANARSRSARADPVRPAAVRTAREADGAALQRIDVTTWASNVSPAPQRSASGRFFGSKTSPADVLVAEVGGVVAGYVHLGPMYELKSSEHVLEVKGLAVDPGRQGSGLGRLLLDAAVEAARERGARRLTLHVLASNAPARRLYEACGFSVEGLLRGQFLLEGGYVDDVVMALELTD